MVAIKFLVCQVTYRERAVFISLQFDLGESCILYRHEKNIFLRWYTHLYISTLPLRAANIYIMLSHAFSYSKCDMCWVNIYIVKIK